MAFREEIYNSFVKDFSSILREKTNDLEISKLIFLCIGTNKVIGDCFGPLVGYKLKYFLENKKYIDVCGGLDYIICRHNILSIVNDIKNTYKRPFFIAVDSAISNKVNIGKIIVSKNSMYIGSSLNKKDIYVGDMSIKGIVSKDLNNSKYNFKLLQNTSIKLIMNMSDIAVRGICDVINV